MRAMTIGGKRYPLGQKTYIMGILNVTPDSFSDGGHYNATEGAISHALNMQSEGADLIDIGGESTRPNSDPVSLAEELGRVLPILKAVRDKVALPISIDTYKAEVAHQSLAMGAAMINDIWGFQKDPEMAAVVAQYCVPAVLMHNQVGTHYERDIIDAMKAFFHTSIELALKNGVKDEHILLDPGIGFGKTYEQNILVLRRLKELKCLGYPLLLGTSRKSVLNRILNVPPKERVYGTIATTVLAAECGCDFVRVHDVRQNLEAARVADAIYRGADY